MRLKRRALAIAILVTAILVVAVLDANRPRVLAPQGSVEFGRHDPEPLALSIGNYGGISVLQRLNNSLQVQAFHHEGWHYRAVPVRGCKASDWGGVVLSTEWAEPKYARLWGSLSRKTVQVTLSHDGKKASWRPIPISMAGLSEYINILPTYRSVCVTGGTDMHDTTFATAIRTDYSGVRQWKTVEKRVDGCIGPAAVDDDGNIIVIGDIGAGCGPFLVKFSAAGKRMWARETEITDGTSAIWVGVDRDGRIATIFAQHEGVMASSGDDMSRRGQDFVLSMYSPTGRLLKTTVLSHGAGLWMRDAAFNSRGEIIIVGNRRRTSLLGYPMEHQDAQLMKCGANGDIIWSRRIKLPPGCCVHEIEVDELQGIYLLGLGEKNADVKGFVYWFRDPK